MSCPCLQFDELEILRQASLHFVTSVPTDLDARLIRGDRSGLIRLHSEQSLTAEHEESRLKAFTRGINFIIDLGAELIVPAHTYVYGDHAQAWDWSGRVTGVSLFVVGQHKTVFAQATAHTAYQQNGTSRICFQCSFLKGRIATTLKYSFAKKLLLFFILHYLQVY
jgi:hypothetical protein